MNNNSTWCQARHGTDKTLLGHKDRRSVCASVPLTAPVKRPNACIETSKCPCVAFARSIVGVAHLFARPIWKKGSDALSNCYVCLVETQSDGLQSKSIPQILQEHSRTVLRVPTVLTFKHTVGAFPLSLKLRRENTPNGNESILKKRPPIPCKNIFRLAWGGISANLKAYINKTTVETLFCIYRSRHRRKSHVTLNGAVCVRWQNHWDFKAFIIIIFSILS